MIVAIDGPAGSGKSTIAKLLADRLSLLYIDTGAMYRALTLKALAAKIDPKDTAGLIRLAKNTGIKFLHKPGRDARVELDGRDVTEKIRAPRLTNSVFYVARVPGVRAEMVKLQRAAARSSKKGAVLEGRDIGTVVFPRAFRKFYLDADIKERTARRLGDLEKAGHKVPVKKLRADIKYRDREDKTRKTAPLKRAEDAIYIDTSRLNIREVLKAVLSYI